MDHIGSQKNQFLIFLTHKTLKKSIFSSFLDLSTTFLKSNIILIHFFHEVSLWKCLFRVILIIWPIYSIKKVDFSCSHSKNIEKIIILRHFSHFWPPIWDFWTFFIKCPCGNLYLCWSLQLDLVSGQKRFFLIFLTLKTFSFRLFLAY